MLPGQATAYKVGMMDILDVREKTNSAWGDKLVLGECHDVVLKKDAVPWDILDWLFEKWMVNKLGSNW